MTGQAQAQAQARGMPWRAILAGLICTVLTFCHAWMGVIQTRLLSVRTEFKLSIPGASEIVMAEGVDGNDISRGLLIAPTKQAILNEAMVYQVATQPDTIVDPWIAALRHLGWRDIPTQQNLLSFAVARQDIPRLVETADALLRQMELAEETMPFVAVAEATPQTARSVVALLASNVRWRADYLKRTSLLTTGVMLDARANTMYALAQTPTGVRESELRAFIGALIDAGRFAHASKLWSRLTNAEGAEFVYDGSFQRASLNDASELQPIAFDWSLKTDVGFAAATSADGLGGQQVMIEWDGRGVPVFLNQRTRATIGNYQMRIRANGDLRALFNRLGFRLMCGPNSVDLLFNQIEQSKPIQASDTIEVKCDYPILEVYGKIQNVTRPFDGIISQISLVRTRR